MQPSAWSAEAQLAATCCMNEMKLLTSVKKLSIALLILIPEDLQCGTRASGQSDSCVVSEIPGKTLKTDPRVSVHDVPSAGWRTVRQSVCNYSMEFTLCFMGYSSNRVLLKLLLPEVWRICAPPQRLRVSTDSVRFGGRVFGSTERRAAEAKTREAGETLETLTRTRGQQSWSSSSSCGPLSLWLRLLSVRGAEGIKHWC